MKNKLLITAIIGTMSMGVAHAEFTPMEKKIIENRTAMQDMNPQQRRELRQSFQAGMDKDAKFQYIKAHDSLKEAGLLPKLSRQVSVTPMKSGNRVPGTQITYDTGSAGTLMGTDRAVIGNLFDNAYNDSVSAIKPVESSGTVSNVTFSLNSSFGLNTFVVVGFYGNIDTGAGAGSQGVGQRVGSTLPAGMQSFAVSSLSYTGGGPFFAGIRKWDSDTAVNLDPSSVNGQGFHAAEIGLQNSAGTGTGFASIPSMNAIFRVSGNVTTPVELMNFSVE